MTRTEEKLTRIQMVVYLQAVELFGYCSAEQMVRIASIARQSRFPAGERIYSRNDPADTIYCVVDGHVIIRSQAEEHSIGSRETFGIREILSDRLRGADASARTEVLALCIDADDFFDLLSNNIEIVKALFRKLLGAEEEGTKERPSRELTG